MGRGINERRNEMAQEIFNNELLAERQQIITGLDSLKIETPADYKKAGELLMAVRALRKKIETYFKPLKEAAHRAWRAICEQEKKELERLTPYEKIVQDRMLQYQAKEAARAKAEAEKLLKEIKAKAEEQILKAAIAAESAGMGKQADEILNQAEKIKLPPAEKLIDRPKAAGTSIREVWDFAIEDASQIPREFLMPDTSKIRSFIQQEKEKAKIPGVKIYKRQIMIVRT